MVITLNKIKIKTCNSFVNYIFVKLAIKTKLPDFIIFKNVLQLSLYVRFIVNIFRNMISLRALCLRKMMIF